MEKIHNKKTKENDEEKREMTSAIHGMTVAEVRKCLSALRKIWAGHGINNPIDLSYKLSNNFCISHFAFEFVLGHHKKRHLKGKVHDKKNVSADAGH